MIKQRTLNEYLKTERDLIKLREEMAKITKELREKETEITTKRWQLENKILDALRKGQEVEQGVHVAVLNILPPIVKPKWKEVAFSYMKDLELDEETELREIEHMYGKDKPNREKLVVK